MQRNRGYRFIFWGILLTMLHINLGNTEILPNFIALMIMARGIYIVLADNQNKELQRALQWCKIYIGVQGIAFLVELIQDEIFFKKLRFIFYDTMPTILFAADTILTILVLFYLFIGSEILLIDEGRKDCLILDWEKGEKLSLVKDLSKGAIIFVVVYTIGALLTMPVLIFGEEFGMLAVTGGLMVFAEYIWVLTNIAYIRRQYPECR